MNSLQSDSIPSYGRRGGQCFKFIIGARSGRHRRDEFGTESGCTRYSRLEQQNKLIHLIKTTVCSHKTDQRVPINDLSRRFFATPDELVISAAF